MFKRVSNIALIVILGSALVMAVVKALPAEGVSVQANASNNGSATTPAGTVNTTSTTAQTTQSTQTAESTRTTPTTKVTQATRETQKTEETKKSQTKTAPSASSSSAKSLKQVFLDKGIDPAESAISIAVDKSEHTLSILADGKVMKSYHVELGEGGSGDKKVSGDHKTPEGTFYITEREVLSPADYYLGTRWMELSYPNKEDAQRGLSAGLISEDTYESIVSAIDEGEMPPQNTALGGGVGIHGGSTASFGSNWTFGCVGLTNKDVEDFYGYVHVGTKVVISK